MGMYMFVTSDRCFAHYVMAASMTDVVPVICIFFAAQQYFVKASS